MPLMGCQIGSSLATERVDGPPRMAGSIGPAPATCTLPSFCGGANAWLACCAACFALSKNPITVSKSFWTAAPVASPLGLSTDGGPGYRSQQPQRFYIRVHTRAWGNRRAQIGALSDR